VDLNRVVEKTLENCKTAVAETQAVVTSDTLPTVAGNEVQFIQLFQNLITNALKYRSEKPPQIRVSAIRLDGMWRLGVADNGIGIAPEYHRQVFGVFKRLHGRGIPGTGIGLAICQRVVEGLGGRIWVESQAGEGATLYFTVPAAEGAAQAHES
jgi:chemotaxis family two-component system sensor kinase Cph1